MIEDMSQPNEAGEVSRTNMPGQLDEDDLLFEEILRNFHGSEASKKSPSGTRVSAGRPRGIIRDPSSSTSVNLPRQDSNTHDFTKWGT